MGKIIKEKRHKKSQIKTEKINLLLKGINNFLLNYFNWIVFIIALIILVSGFIIIIEPKYELVVQDIGLFSKDRGREYLIQKAYLDKLNKLKADYESISLKERNKIGIILPKEPRIEELFSEIEAMVMKNGLILTSLLISSEEAEFENNKIASKNNNNKEDKEAEAEDLFKEIGRIKITMNIIGTDYDGLKNLLGAKNSSIPSIENNLRLMDIESINFSPSNKSTSLELVTYYMK